MSEVTGYQDGFGNRGNLEKGYVGGVRQFHGQNGGPDLCTFVLEKLEQSPNIGRRESEPLPPKNVSPFGQDPVIVERLQLAGKGQVQHSARRPEAVDERGN